MQNTAYTLAGKGLRAVVGTVFVTPSDDLVKSKVMTLALVM